MREILFALFILLVILSCAKDVVVKNVSDDVYSFLLRGEGSYGMPGTLNPDETSKEVSWAKDMECTLSWGFTNESHSWPKEFTITDDIAIEISNGIMVIKQSAD